jgi:hypothetical protein
VILSIGVLPSVFIFYYILHAQLFLQPQPVLCNHAISYYMIDALLFLWPQHVLYTEHALLCYMIGTQLYIQPQRLRHRKPGRDSLTPMALCIGRLHSACCIMYSLLSCFFGLSSYTVSCIIFSMGNSLFGLSAYLTRNRDLTD